MKGIGLRAEWGGRERKKSEDLVLEFTEFATSFGDKLQIKQLKGSSLK